MGSGASVEQSIQQPIQPNQQSFEQSIEQVCELTGRPASEQTGKQATEQPIEQAIENFEKWPFLGKGGYGTVRRFNNIAIKREICPCTNILHEYNASEQIRAKSHLLPKLNYIAFVFSMYHKVDQKTKLCYIAMPVIEPPYHIDFENGGGLSFAMNDPKLVDEVVGNRHMIGQSRVFDILGVSSDESRRDVLYELGLVVGFLCGAVELNPLDFQGIAGKSDDGRNRLHILDYGMYEPLAVRNPKSIKGALEAIWLSMFLPNDYVAFWNGFLDALKRYAPGSFLYTESAQYAQDLKAKENLIPDKFEKNT